MFRKILVPVDLSDKNRGAVEKAAELASQSGGELTLLHVIETIQDVPREELEDFYATLEEKARASLESWRSEFAGKGLDVQQDVAFGRRAPEIVREAERRGADLIVLTSHAVDRDHPVRSLGTISHQVAVMAGCAVLLVR